MSFRIMDLMVDVTPLPLAACPNSGPGGGADPDGCPNSGPPDSPDCPNSGTTGYTQAWSVAALPELRRQLRATLDARA
jgi:hypothetical protein